MGDDSKEGESTGQQVGKVQRVLDKYGLEEAGEEL
jgi:hypothetical protein